jgi:hypothetical protein
MRTFKEYLHTRESVNFTSKQLSTSKKTEYNTTGEVDGENNTDLGKQDQPKTRWFAAKRKCGLGGLPCSKYVAQMKEK